VTETPEGCTLTVCRDCCCGNALKHPSTDHNAQLDRLREALAPAHRVRTSLCLDVCDEANVMVVHPTPTARRQGATPVWFGLVLTDAVENDLLAWVRAGGPGVAELPPVLDLSVIPAPGR
jgi:(2Fe-2S) ferredoxin